MFPLDQGMSRAYVIVISRPNLYDIANNRISWRDLED